MPKADAIRQVQYREHITVVDLLETGACFDGVCLAIKRTQGRITAPTEVVRRRSYAVNIAANGDVLPALYEGPCDQGGGCSDTVAQTRFSIAVDPWGWSNGDGHGDSIFDVYPTALGREDGGCFTL